MPSFRALKIPARVKIDLRFHLLCSLARSFSFPFTTLTETMIAIASIARDYTAAAATVLLKLSVRPAIRDGTRRARGYLDENLISAVRSSLIKAIFNRIPVASRRESREKSM